jgi:NAD(P)-dependent dehydrogenase (short-subunit alcohol dehydrogenase family)
MDKRLSGKVAVVLGAGNPDSGCSNGGAAAIRYAQEGAAVLCVDRDLDAARRTASAIADQQGIAVAAAGDVTSKADLVQIKSTVLERFGRVDILHNNVGVELVNELEDITEDAWDFVHDVNLKSVMLSCQQFIPLMVEQGSGVVTNISSTASIRPGTMPYLSYCTSKAGLNHMTRVLARRYAASGVRVNVILPGMIRTAHAIRLYEDPVRANAERDARCPTGAQGTPEDIAAAAAFLASADARYITGIELRVDGGLSI